MNITGHMTTANVNTEPEQELPTFRLTETLPPSADLSQQIETLLKLFERQQASIQRLIELVELLISSSPAHVQEGPFEWLSHSQYVTAYPRIVSAITSGLPKQRTLETVLDISKGGGTQWVKASHDWDRLKMSMP